MLRAEQVGNLLSWFEMLHVVDCIKNAEGELNLILINEKK